MRVVTMPRVLLLLFALCTTTMIFITRCGISFDSLDEQPQRRALKTQLLSPPNADELQRRVAETEAAYKEQVSHLELRVSELQAALQSSHGGVTVGPKPSTLDPQLQQKLEEAEVLHGIQLNNEYELIPFCRFTLTRLYLVDPGLGKRVVEKPIGYKKRELLEVINFSIEQLNEMRKPDDRMYSTDDFLEGIYRTLPAVGTQYELYYRDIDYKSTPTRYLKSNIFRPYDSLTMVSRQQVHTKKDMINLILPLAGRVDKFKQFMERFIKVCIRVDKRVFLTVVYFGSNGLNEVKNIIGATSKNLKFKNMKLIALNESFSRGRGLQVGAQSWLQGDVLLFLCDVDIVFSTDFLERCRLNAERGARVYYPIVFSLYNPQVVYSLQDLPIPPENEQLIISKDTGFWRDFGYGMTCQYRSDLLQMKGFDETIQGWGLEDVLLYRKYVKSTLMVVRATDPGIFHLWHEKVCDAQLPTDQYKGCIRSKALNEASHAQLGMLAFKEEIDKHKALLKNIA